MIKVAHIGKRYGKKTVLKDISFGAEPGEQIAIVGRNGCGKTTLMKILSGIQKPDHGTLEYYGQNPLQKKGCFRKLCGYVPQEDPLIEELSVKDNLKLWGGKKSLLDKRLRDMFDLDEIMKVTVHKLSGGMKRRVSIACAISQWPSILFMDEPTAAVDLYYKRVLRDWMKQYISMNGIIILSTHDEQEIKDSKRCFLLQEGQIKESCVPEVFTEIREENKRNGREI
ncbi:MAG: ABC transporter ATP-binding protein [Lachnospiraceae bacterium]|jgi:ABC-2 type transport system ATP-binding protein|nr:ABC transporter ATP-binding protein [Lachnospiraceae bacterium]